MAADKRFSWNQRPVRHWSRTQCLEGVSFAWSVNWPVNRVWIGTTHEIRSWFVTLKRNRSSPWEGAPLPFLNGHVTFKNRGWFSGSLVNRVCNYTISERFLLRWLVESYGLYHFRPRKWCDDGRMFFPCLSREFLQETSLGIDFKNYWCFLKMDIFLQIKNNFLWSKP